MYIGRIRAHETYTAFNKPHVKTLYREKRGRMVSDTKESVAG
jgi:hypothetical protein